MISKNSERRLTASLIWKIEGDSQFEAQLVDALGQSIVEFHSEKEEIYSRGNEQFNLSTTQNGLLSVSGYSVPIARNELGCLLNGNFPSNWLKSIIDSEAASDTIELLMKDKSRTMSVVLTSSPREYAAQNYTKGCAVLKWGGFLGIFEKELKFCRTELREGVTVQVSGINDLQIDWHVTREN